MFVKQITLEEASDLREMIPDTLQNMLSGVMFFRREPALEKPMIDLEEDPPPTTKN